MSGGDGVGGVTAHSASMVLRLGSSPCKSVRRVLRKERELWKAGTWPRSSHADGVRN